MRTYLVQHGHAVTKEVDPDRPLSARGLAEVGHVAALLARAGVRPSAIWHSGKRRAQETAALLGDALRPGGGVEQVSGISPLDPPSEFLPALAEQSTDTMVVGHLPLMARLVSLLVRGDQEVATVAFEPGSVVCLERGEDDGWAIAWMIRPEIAAAVRRNPLSC